MRTILRALNIAKLVLLYPFFDHKVCFWRYKLMGTAFTWVNRHKFRHMGEDVFLSSDIILRGPELIEIGNECSVGRRSSLTAWGSRSANDTALLSIGQGTSIGEGAHITAANRITIGRNTLFGKYVTVSDNNHGANSLAEIEVAPAHRPLVSKGPVVIEDNVWIGDKATILAGVTIGKGSVVAANSVVIQSVPDGTVVAGVPARPVRNIK